jgi:hypothetical protein
VRLKALETNGEVRKKIKELEEVSNSDVRKVDFLPPKEGEDETVERNTKVMVDKLLDNIDAKFPTDLLISFLYELLSPANLTKWSKNPHDGEGNENIVEKDIAV